MRSTMLSRAPDRTDASKKAICLAALSCVTLASCALDKGQPWGELSVLLEVGPLIDEGRLRDGLWLTSRDYLLDLDIAELEVASVALVASGESSAFDPSDPPEGYSNCHNGHCHHASGRIVDYGNIANELALAGALAPALIIGGGVVNPEAGASVLVETNLCSTAEPCVIDTPMRLETLIVTTARLSVSGRVFDRRTGERARLPEDGVPFSVSIPESRVAGPIDISFGPQEDLQVGLRARLDVPSTLFDDVDWGSSDLPVLGGLLATRLGRDGRVSVELTGR